MRTSSVIAILVGVLLSFASVAGAAGYLWSRDDARQQPPAKALPTVWPTNEGQALRAVPIPTGDLVAALPPDTAGQVLCQAVSQQRWDYVLGSPALREVRDGGCHVVTATTDVDLRLDGAPAALHDARPMDIAGRAGEVEYLPPGVNARLNVRLVAAEASNEIKPFLRVAIGRDSAPGLDELAVTIAREVVAATMTAGPGLPAQSKDRAIPMHQVEPVPGHGIVDSPWPMISWQLCTRLARELGAGVANAKPRFDGQCIVRGIQATYTDQVSPRAYPDTLAGRPALISDDLVAVKLTDDSAQELTFTGSSRSLRALAEKAVPALLGR